ncbi:MAG: diguanylate cyclase, partial [Phormidesmis sp.]
VLNSTSEGVAAIDTSGLIKFMNPVAEVLTGWSQTEALGRSPAEVFHFIDQATRKLVENPLSISLRENSPVCLPKDALLLTRQGHEVPVADSAAPVYNDQGRSEGAVMVVRDSTEQRRIEAQLEHNALHDALTGLPNRGLFLDRLQQAIDRAAQSPDCGFAIMMLDLDRFKSINDTLGHLIGDQMLVEVAPRLQAHLRSMDTVARLGGDEFAVLIADISDIAVACRAAERILDEIKQPFLIEHHELLITASIGIVMNFIPYEQAADLLRHADIAMYRSKKRGCGGYELFDTVMHAQARELMQREQSLRYAIRP